MGRGAVGVATCDFVVSSFACQERPWPSNSTGARPGFTIGALTIGVVVVAMVTRAAWHRVISQYRVDDLYGIGDDWIMRVTNAISHQLQEPAINNIFSSELRT